MLLTVSLLRTLRTPFEAESISDQGMPSCPFSEEKPSSCDLVNPPSDILNGLFDVETMSELENFLKDKKDSVKAFFEAFDSSKYSNQQLEKLALLNKLSGGQFCEDSSVFLAKSHKKTEEGYLGTDTFIRGSAAFNIYIDQTI